MYLYVCLGLLFVYSVVSTYFCIKFAMTVLRVQDSIQESLTVVDDRCESISEILSRPLFYDSPEVRRVLKDIEATRDSLESVARDLVNKLEDEEKKT
jgi:hypothetical protein